MPRKINLIVIHSADTPNGREQTVHDIDAWHRQRGFKRTASVKDTFNPSLTSIGYHFVIYVDGTVHTGRSIDEAGAHVAGFNSRSIGICMIGKDKFNGLQWIALRDLLNTLKRDLKFTGLICGHRDLSPDKDGDGTVEPHEWLKTCPGFNVPAWFASGHIHMAGHIMDVPHV